MSAPPENPPTPRTGAPPSPPGVPPAGTPPATASPPPGGSDRQTPQANPAGRAPRPLGPIAGIAATAGVHLGLLGVVLLGSRGEARPRATPRSDEIVVQTRIVEVQAGSAAGTRTTGPAYRRRSAARPRRARATPRSLVLGRRSRGDRRLPPRRRATVIPPDDGKDDAADVPEGWGSDKGVDAPPGARPSDDKHGAGGTADKGALDPCFTQHDQVVAGYRAQVARKIPRMPRPAFITADVAENLSTVVRVALDRTGRIVQVTVARPSGNPQFDAAAAAHVRGVGQLPAPHRCVLYDKVAGRFRARVTFAVTVRAR